MAIDQRLIFVCHSSELTDGDYRRIDIHFKNTPSSVIVLRHQGQALAYHNLCVHMPRELDCESRQLLSAGQLRCSMHGISYNVITGESLSDICRGQSLTAIRLLENQQGLWINDKRVKQLPATSG